MECKVWMASQKYDEVSLISHLPIFLACALIETANKDSNKPLLELTQNLAASGFADVTRDITHN